MATRGLLFAKTVIFSLLFLNPGAEDCYFQAKMFIDNKFLNVFPKINHNGVVC